MLQNTTALDNQMRHLVYLIENAILNLPQDQEQMSWLIDFTGWSLTNNVPIKSARETVNILQNHYPERLAIAFLYNPPRIFQAFWKVCSESFFFSFHLFYLLTWSNKKKPSKTSVLSDKLFQVFTNLEANAYIGDTSIHEMIPLGWKVFFFCQKCFSKKYFCRVIICIRLINLKNTFTNIEQ